MPLQPPVSPRRIGVIYNPRTEAAVALAQQLAEAISRQSGTTIWLCAATEVEKGEADLPGTELIITVGGDGTILRAVRVAVAGGVPLLGINMGGLGFMTELRGKEALKKVGRYLDGRCWIEERAMLEVAIRHLGGREGEGRYRALNDVVVGRSSTARAVFVDTWVDGGRLTTFRADAVIVASATGSTGYALAAGGPILPPQSRDMLLLPVAAHLVFSTPLVLPSSSTLRLRVRADNPIILSVDGYLDMPLPSGTELEVKAAQQVAHFLRAKPPSHFYATLTRRLKPPNG